MRKYDQVDPVWIHGYWILAYLYLHQSLTSEPFCKGTSFRHAHNWSPELARADYFIPVDLMGPQRALKRFR